MSITYQFTSAEELNTDIVNDIKARFKSKSITIIVAEQQVLQQLSADMKQILDERLQEDETSYLTSKQSVDLLNKKYGL